MGNERREFTGTRRGILIDRGHSGGQSQDQEEEKENKTFSEKIHRWERTVYIGIMIVTVLKHTDFSHSWIIYNVILRIL